MVKDWAPEDRGRYHLLIDEETRIGCLVMCILAILLFPIFGALDYYTQYEKLHELWTIRGHAFSFYIVILGYILTFWKTFNVKVIAFSMGAIASLVITIQCNVLGGFSSPYYTGIILVMVTTVAVFPVATGLMSAMIGLEVLVYLVGCLAYTNFTIDPSDAKALTNNMFIIVATAFVGIIGSWWTEKSRVLSFNRFLQIEGARTSLKKSLASEQETVEMLIKEITERKSELEHALNLRKEFISLASHELNTPLTSLKLITQMVKLRMTKKNLDHETIEKLITTYDEQILRLTRIVKDMLDVSRIENGRLSLQRNEFDLEKLVSDSVQFSSVGYTGHLTFKSQGPIFGQWDPIRIEQVIHNLVNNAIKYGQGNPIDVNLQKEKNFAILSVKDRGIGVPEDFQSRIFERFERAVNPYQYSGLGMGLYIANQIILEHDGSIHLVSKPGEGSEFTVRLPIPGP